MDRWKSHTIESNGFTENAISVGWSPAGTVQIPVRISDDLMRGIVAFPHDWGHKGADGLSIASKNSGINANFITPD